MNRGNLRAAIREVLREPIAARWSDATINGYINNALVEASRALSRQKTATANAAETIPLPNDCLILSDVFWVGEDKDLSIEREFYEQVPLTKETGIPKKYWLIDGVVHLRPIPEEGTVKLLYYYLLPQLDTDEDVPLEGFDLFIKSHAIYEAYFDDGDPRYEIWDARRRQELASWIASDLSSYATGFKVKERF